MSFAFQPVSKIEAVRPGEEFAAIPGRSTFHEFYDPFQRRQVAVNCTCLPSVPGERTRGCSHRVIIDGSGVLNLHRQEIQNIYNGFETEAFFEDFKRAFEASGVSLATPALRMVLDFVFAPPVHFRQLEMNSLLTLSVGRAEQNHFAELFSHRYGVDETTETALMAICRSVHASPVVVRKFIRHFPSTPVTSASLVALCERSPEHETEEQDGAAASEIAYYLLSFPNCVIDSSVMKAVNMSVVVGLRATFVECLTRPGAVQEANARAKAMRVHRRARRSFQLKDCSGGSSNTLDMYFEGVQTTPHARGSYKDFRGCNMCWKLYYLLCCCTKDTAEA
jgi:hypothetical protein